MKTTICKRHHVSEVRLSNCQFKCKVYQCAGCGASGTFHNVTYGCRHVSSAPMLALVAPETIRCYRPGTANDEFRKTPDPLTATVLLTAFRPLTLRVLCAIHSVTPSSHRDTMIRRLIAARFGHWNVPQSA
jgi:hypothetical protein